MLPYVSVFRVCLRSQYIYSCTRTAFQFFYVSVNYRCMRICFYACFFVRVWLCMHAFIPPTVMPTLCFLFPFSRPVWAAGGFALPAAAPCQPPRGQRLPPGHVWGEEPPVAGQGKTKKAPLCCMILVLCSLFWGWGGCSDFYTHVGIVRSQQLPKTKFIPVRVEAPQFFVNAYCQKSYFYL